MIALVTGAASGMGRIAAQRLAAAGATVAAVDIDTEGLAATALRSPNTRTFRCDIADAEDVATVVERIGAELGPIEHLVHAAGLCRVGPILDQPLDELDRVHRVNYLGTAHLCRAVVPGMVRARRGTVVLFGSLSGWLPSPRLAAYSASKSAVAAYAEVLAAETGASGVRVLCVCPGQVETPLAEGVRAVDSAALGGLRGADPERVLDAVDTALQRNRPPLFLFPGSSRPLAWARRVAPGLLRRAVSAGTR
ncbi:SDR family oxidoreductase [Saccharopolyspora sp. HNM0983]|uniref:SDR family oxidoreductase n=1 Tax=Saccharopolyspora montiporae TaxID=2781240 RepID=A0A929B7Q4_9PSEU|nr:SDR family oxidoreductase [Saccharopolyspora sp. HNM0983]MBE9373740.1 SDR family oxidoreductase [Saccharopolyspora sp. HNM0983]